MANTLKLGAGKWATGKDTVLSFNDENNNFKPLPFSFSRASSATVVNQSGLIETVGSGEPRIDFLDNTEGALLLEPQRTNLFEYSESFSNSYWTKNGSTETIGYLAPDGTLNAYKLIANATDSSIYKVFSVTSGTTYSLSFYLKTVSGTLETTIGLGSPGFPQNEGDGGRYKSITVTNEWKRYTLTSTADATASSGISFGGFGGFSTGEEVLIYGAQLEQGSYATSYIKSNSGSATTRVQEISENLTNNINNFGTSNFSLFIESYIKEGYNARLKKMQTWTTRGYAFYLNAYGLRGRVYGDSQIDTNYVGIGSVINNSKNKALMVVDRVLNTITIYSNGVNVHSQSIASIAGDSLDNTAPLEFQRAINVEAGLINDFKIYNTALNNAEAIALTQ